jgi:septal ring factor EnvC (AmiA/AmiB activator)
LEETEKTKSAGLNKLLIIKKRIDLREQLINNIAEEIEYLEKNIQEKTNNIEKLENEIKTLKSEYAKMIYFAYKNRNNYDRLMFILSAEDFNQAYRRMKYFQQYSKYRKKQAQQIVISQKNLAYEIEQLKDKKNEKLDLLTKKEKEKTHLTAEKTKENRELIRLQKKEQELKRKIKQNERAMKELENAIAELVAREAASNKTYKTLSASEEVISNQFKSNKGKLNWPIDKGLIIRDFGEHAHPIIKGVKINNDGIDIGASKDSKVKTVFEGEVKKVIAVPGANMAVIIRHGHYLTLYSNIVNVRVKVGDVVREGFTIGDVYYNENNEEGSTMHFRVYEETQVLNPKIWLRNR